MNKRIINPYPQLYSVINSYTPQCSDLTEEDQRLMKRIKFTTIKTNEPEYLYHGDGEKLASELTAAKGTKPGGETHQCVECVPLPPGHPFRKGSLKKTPKKYRGEAPLAPQPKMRTVIDTSQLTERLRLRRPRKRLLKNQQQA